MDRNQQSTSRGVIRSRWAAVGAAVAITLGGGGIGLVSATSPVDAVAYVPIEPCRIADTRPDPAVNVGPRSTPIGADEIHVIAAHGDNGDCTGIPTSATGLQLNVTALNASQNTFVTVWGDGVRPNASSLNPALGQPPAPNAVTTGLTATGRFNVFNRFGNVDVIADVVGYYTDHNHDDRYYTKAATDAVHATKANVANVYTKADVDSALDGTVRNENGKSAYAFVSSFAATRGIGVVYNLTTNVGYDYNPSGDVTVERTAIGVYNVRFLGLNMTFGHVQVTAYGSTNTQCKVSSWSGSTTTVRCFDPAGALSNGAFTILAFD